MSRYRIDTRSSIRHLHPSVRWVEYDDYFARYYDSGGNFLAESRCKTANCMEGDPGPWPLEVQADEGPQLRVWKMGPDGLMPVMPLIVWWSWCEWAVTHGGIDCPPWEPVPEGDFVSAPRHGGFILRSDIWTAILACTVRMLIAAAKGRLARRD